VGFVSVHGDISNCMHLRFCELGWDLPRWMRLFKHRFGLSGGLLCSGWFALAGTSVSRHCSSDASAGSSVDSTSEAWELSSIVVVFAWGYNFSFVCGVLFFVHNIFGWIQTTLNMSGATWQVGRRSSGWCLYVEMGLLGH
jgi:hypothetical protein